MDKMKGTRKVLLDTMCGLIPCKIIKFISFYSFKNKYGVENIPSSSTVIQVEVTEDSYGFKKGEILDYWSIHVIPSHKIAYSKISSYIKGYRLNDYFNDNTIPESLKQLEAVT
jgi:hypothetical protein